MCVSGRSGLLKMEPIGTTYYSLIVWISWTFRHLTFTGWQSAPTSTLRYELGVVKLRHALSTSLESFRILHEYKLIAVVVHDSMYAGVERDERLFRLRCCRVYRDDDGKKAVLYECAGGACSCNATQLSERHDVSKNEACPYYSRGVRDD